MSVDQLIKKHPVTIPAGSPALRAAERMINENVGLVVITDPNNPRKVVGVLSERDILRAVVSERKLESPADAIGTLRVIKVKVGTPVWTVAKLMTQHRIRHMVVVDEQDSLLGVISIRDLLEEQSTLKALVESYESEQFQASD